MSYAEAAKKGPKQSPEEARAPPQPSPVRDDSTASLVDVDSPHVQSVDSSFRDQEVKTETQAQRLEAEASSEARKLRAMASAEADKAKKRAATRGKQGKAEAKKQWNALQENRDNPVVIGNAVIWAVGLAALGFGAYQKHTEGKLDAKVAGYAAAGVAAFAAADYYASQWLFENKYPTK